jgi:ankyrin repeat protein
MGNAHGTEGQADALSEAASRGCDEDVQRLLEKGKADVNFRDSSRWTALHRAAHNGHAFTTDLLISYGADVNAQTKWGSTPLHYAASNGHALTVRMLLSRGADKEAKNGAGNTALDEARDCNHRDCVLILERGPSSSSLFDLADENQAPGEQSHSGRSHNGKKVAAA